MIRSAVASLADTVGAVQFYRADSAALVAFCVTLRLATSLAGYLVIPSPLISAPSGAVGGTGVNN
jgi:hypothetical protein